MSTRTSIYLSRPLPFGYDIHIYRETLNDRIYLDFGRQSYNTICFPIVPARAVRAWQARRVAR